MDRRLIFLLGGARSGKSAYAEDWARSRERVLFVATAQAFDDEMRERIAAHRASRPADWHTLEAPLNVGEAIRNAAPAFDTLIVDCVTLLASNVLLQLPETCTQAEADAAVLSEIDSLLEACAGAECLIISNEVGMGIVPPYRLGRLFRDSLGRANQRIASAADEVYLLVAGLAWPLKR